MIIGEPDACGGVLALLETVDWMHDGWATAKDVVMYIKTCMMGGRTNWVHR
jgi:hypothetical protein